MTPTYLGMTKEDYLQYFIYDQDSGVVKSRKTEKVIGQVTGYGLIHTFRIEKKIKTISLGKLCYFLYHNVDIGSGKKIVYLDDNTYNLKPDNLKLVGKVDTKEDLGRLSVVETETVGVFYNPNNNLFVVRRKDDQAVYRTFSYQEAVAVRVEWESDKSIHRWDRFSESFRKFL